LKDALIIEYDLKVFIQSFNPFEEWIISWINIGTLS